jgi:hypothetical protein
MLEFLFGVWNGVRILKDLVKLFVKLEQYLFIGGFNSDKEHIMGIREEPYNNCIQVWKLDAVEKSLKLSFLICHNFGSLFDLKFNPIYTPDQDVIGCIACTFSDGSVRVTFVPNPSKIAFSYHGNIFTKKSILENQYI